MDVYGHDAAGLAARVADMKADATHFVQRYAATRTPDVPLDEVEAICQALGDISIDEATAALDRMQRDADGKH